MPGVIKTGKGDGSEPERYGPDGSKFKPPDPGNGTGVRFGCGALFGAVAAVGGSTYAFRHGPGFAIGLALAGALVCGLLSARYGEAFWEDIISRRRW